MKACVVFLLAAGVSMFTLAESLECYSCPNGSAGRCNNTVQCSSADDSCLKLTSEKPTVMTYTRCIKFSACGVEELALLYPTISKFSSRCCQSNLCNSAHSVAAQPLIGLLVGLAALCWGMH